MKTAIRKNMVPFLFVVGLIVVAALVGGYILSNQRFRFPLVEDEPMKMKIELNTAQAVTPGQGQTVQVSGVKIGSIGNVKLRDGRALVEVEIEKEFDDVIREDATANLRPRTGLKDMYVQVIPGKGKVAPEGFTIPAANTMTDVDLDEILSTLDDRTREYLTLLADGAGKGLKNRGGDLAEVLKRFEPTFRDLRRVNQEVGKERVALRRLVSSLAGVNGELARRPKVVSRLVDRAAVTFRAFASEDDNLRSAVGELGPTLSQATSTLRVLQPFANELGPTTKALVPAVRQLDRANRDVRPFAREAAPIVRDPIRPFVRAARPLARDLRPAARSLVPAVPELRRAAASINTFTNLAAFNKDGRESLDDADRDEGYLFWLAWVAHQGVNLQSIEDANGPMRPIFLTGTCTTLTSLVNDFPPAELALGLSPLLAGVCSNPQTRSINRDNALRLFDGGGAKKEGGK